MQTRDKKKHVTTLPHFFAVSLALLLLAGCGSKEAAKTEETTPQETAGEVTVEPAPEKVVDFSELSAMDVICAPSGIAATKDGTILVTDVFNKRVWQVGTQGTEVYAGGETTVGLYGEPMGGYNDAGLLASTFRQPWAVAEFMDGWAVSDTANNVVRLVRADRVQTLNPKEGKSQADGGVDVALDRPTGLAADADGNLYIADTGNGAVRKVTAEGEISTEAEGLHEPMGLCFQDGVLYIAETGANRIVKLEDGKIVPVAGSGEEGLEDGAAEAALFAAPQGITAGDDGTLYVSDTLNSAVRRIQGGQVDTLAIRDTSSTGFGLVSPTGLLLQGAKLYVCDVFSKKLFVLEMG